MAATFNWIIRSMESFPLIGDRPNIVYTVYWNCYGIDTDNNGNTVSADHEGSCNIAYQPDTYIPYDLLTPDIVLGWVWNNIDKVSTESTVQSKISSLINPVITTPLPW
jgi:hypothetical protein